MGKFVNIFCLVHIEKVTAADFLESLNADWIINHIPSAQTARNKKIATPKPHTVQSSHA